MAPLNAGSWRCTVATQLTLYLHSEIFWFYEEQSKEIDQFGRVSVLLERKSDRRSTSKKKRKKRKKKCGGEESRGRGARSIVTNDDERRTKIDIEESSEY